MKFREYKKLLAVKISFNRHFIRHGLNVRKLGFIAVYRMCDVRHILLSEARFSGSIGTVAYSDVDLLGLRALISFIISRCFYHTARK